MVGDPELEERDDEVPTEDEPEDADSAAHPT